VTCITWRETPVLPIFMVTVAPLKSAATGLYESDQSV
jgi:hypothetical protein